MSGECQNAAAAVTSIKNGERSRINAVGKKKKKKIERKFFSSFLFYFPMKLSIEHFFWLDPFFFLFAFVCLSSDIFFCPLFAILMGV
jgi:hypothetical protein